MKIGTFEIDNYIALGPMAGVTDLAFRLICKSYGCPIVYTEMVSAKALHFKDPKTKRLMKITRRRKTRSITDFWVRCCNYGANSKRDKFS